MIRRATEGDAEAILGLLRQVNLVHHLGRPDLFKRATKYGKEELCALLSDPERPVFVYDDGRVKGHAFCAIQRVKDDRLLTDRTTLYLDDLCVDERARRQGVGTALYRFVEDYARSSGCRSVTLNVWACNPDALAFYERLGLSVQKIGLEKTL